MTERPTCPECDGPPAWVFDEWAVRHRDDCPLGEPCSVRGCDELPWWKVRQEGKPTLVLCTTHKRLLGGDTGWASGSYEPVIECHHPAEGPNVGDLYCVGDMYLCHRCGHVYDVEPEDPDDDVMPDLSISMEQAVDRLVTAAMELVEANIWYDAASAVDGFSGQDAHILGKKVAVYEEQLMWAGLVVRRLREGDV